MTLTLTQARDSVISTTYNAWTAVGVASEFVPMHYDNVKADRPGSSTTAEADPWARTTVRVISQPQTTQGARRRFLSTGEVTVQIFTSIGDGHSLGDQLAQVLLDAYRSHDSDVDSIWFFDIVTNEIGVDGPWFNTNVTASFRWQEVAA